MQAGTNTIANQSNAPNAVGLNDIAKREVISDVLRSGDLVEPSDIVVLSQGSLP